MLTLTDGALHATLAPGGAMGGPIVGLQGQGQRAMHQQGRCGMPNPDIDRPPGEPWEVPLLACKDRPNGPCISRGVVASHPTLPPTPAEVCPGKQSGLQHLPTLPPLVLPRAVRADARSPALPTPPPPQISTASSLPSAQAAGPVHLQLGQGAMGWRGRAPQ